MSVIIKIDTGFVGAIHEEDTGLSLEDWKALSNEEQWDWLRESIMERIETSVVFENENGDEVEIE